MSFLIKHWKPIAMVIFLSVAVALIYQKGSHDKNQEWSIKDLERISQETKNAVLASEANRKKEREYAQKLANIDHEGQEQIRKVKNEASNTIAALKRDNVRLSVSIKNNSGRACSEGASSSVDNGETRAELSDEAFEFLAGEAERADKITVQLGACQKGLNLIDQ